MMSTLNEIDIAEKEMETCLDELELTNTDIAYQETANYSL